MLYQPWQMSLLGIVLAAAVCGIIYLLWWEDPEVKKQKEKEWDRKIKNYGDCVEDIGDKDIKQKEYIITDGKKELKYFNIAVFWLCSFTVLFWITRETSYILLGGLGLIPCWYFKYSYTKKYKQWINKEENNGNDK